MLQYGRTHSDGEYSKSILKKEHILMKGLLGTYFKREQPEDRLRPVMSGWESSSLPDLLCVPGREASCGHCPESGGVVVQSQDAINACLFGQLGRLRRYIACGSELDTERLSHSEPPMGPVPAVGSRHTYGSYPRKWARPPHSLLQLATDVEGRA